MQMLSLLEADTFYRGLAVHIFRARTTFAAAFFLPLLFVKFKRGCEEG